MPTIAVLSDIHGNLPALQAVVADLKTWHPDATYVLGDMVNVCPWPTEALDLIQAAGWPMILGNHDDAILQLGSPRMEPRYAVRPRYPTLWWTREHLSPAHLSLLASLPLELTPPSADGTPAMRMVHGVPGCFLMGFRPDSPEAWALQRLSAVAEDVVVAGHTHVPMTRRIGRWFVVNSGSVGVPYDGDPRASYAWLHVPEKACSPAGNAMWQAGIRRVPYDLEALDAGFRESGLLAEGAMAEMGRRSALNGLPWLSDFVWWMRDQPEAELDDMQAALARYDASHGPGRWAFPFA
jgi:predicted phosphodiesterase